MFDLGLGQIPDILAGANVRETLNPQQQQTYQYEVSAGQTATQPSIFPVWLLVAAVIGFLALGKSRGGRLF